MLCQSSLRANDLKPGRPKRETSTARVALILGDEFPSHLAESFSQMVYKHGVTVTQIPPDDPRLIHPRGYYECGTAEHFSVPNRPVRLLGEEHASDFDLFEHLNYFADRRGGLITRQWWDKEAIPVIIRFGFV